MPIELNPKSHIKPLEFIEHKLENGLSIILQKDTTIPSVCINTCYHVGSKDEPGELHGFAHLFEHLMFEGSKNISKGQYDKISTSAGGDNNAFTSSDVTNYYIILPSNHLETGLWLESDRMLEFSISEESFNIQKKVVAEEKQQNYDNRPYGTASSEMAPLLFTGTNYAWDTIGDMEQLKNSTLNNAKNFFGKYYNPSNCVLVITGDIDYNKTISLIEKYYSEIPSPPKPIKPKIDFTPLKNESRIIVHDNIHLPGVFIGYRLPKEWSDETVALSLASEILSTGESSRFYKKLVYEKELVSEIAAYIDTREQFSALIIYAILMPCVKIEAVVKEIDSIIDEMKSGKVDNGEITKIKNKFETRIHYRMQTNMMRAEYLTHFKTVHNDASMINSIAEKYLRFTKNDVTENANKFLVDSNRVILEYHPHE